MTTKIDIDTRTFVRFLLVVTAFVGVLFLIWKLWPALLLIGVAFFLALALNPSVSALSRRLPGKSRIFATLIAYILILSVLGAFIYAAVPPTIDQTVRFINQLPFYIQDVSQQRGAFGGFVNDIIVRYQLQDELNRLVEGVQAQAFNVAGGIGGGVVTGVSSFFTGFVTFIVLLVLTFLMLVEGPRWQARFWGLYTNAQKRLRHQRLATQMYRVVSSYVNGQVVVALIAATLGLLTLFVLTLIFPMVPTGIVLPLAGLIFITSLIPMVGATIGASIIVTVLLFNDLAAALSFLVYFIVYQQIENNLIQPIVQSRTVAVTALTIFVAVITGVTLLGIVGGILAIPVAGCLRVIALDYLEHRKATHAPNPRLVSKKT